MHFFFTAELREKTFENNGQREDLIRMKQENQLLKKELNAVELQLLSKSLLDVLCSVDHIILWDPFDLNGSLMSQMIKAKFV